MFHVKPRHFIRTELTVPGAGTAVHVAELEEIDAATCRMLRIIELTPDDRIMGLSGEGRTGGNVPEPAEVVPHPNTYANYPDIEATRLSSEEFDALWSEAEVKFPERG